MKPTVSRCINGVLIGGVIAWTVLFFFREDVARRLVSDDGFVQWMQFLLWGVAALFSYFVIQGYRRYYDSALVRNGFLLLLLLSIFVAGEEISWGQRLLGIETPVFLEEVNVQGELTVHNLRYVHRIRHWGLILIATVGLWMIFRGDSLRKNGSDSSLSPFLPSDHFKGILILILLSGLFVEGAELFRLLSTENQPAKRIRFIAGRYSEIGELLVALVACWYSILKYSEMKRNGLKAGSTVVYQTQSRERKKNECR